MVAEPGVERPPGPVPDDAPIPRRVLLVSADVGEGHHAAGRALQEQVERLWPGSPVRRVDVLETMSPGLASVSRHAYLVSRWVAPWLHEFAYSFLWRHPGLADASKWLCGAVAGRRLAPVIEAFDPDLIASTHPVGTAGLAWLRRRRGLDVPVGAWVVDVAPHPFWIHRDVDLNLVAHPSALPAAAAVTPGAPLAVCERPVSGRFRPGDRDLARRQCSLDPTRAVVLVAGGSLALGAVSEAVRALTALGDRVQVVVASGHNHRLARRLAKLGLPERRLVVRGWANDMDALLRAADVLVTGGATLSEALVTGVPVVAYGPVTAHGKANAAVLTAAGVAEIARTPDGLAACVGSLLDYPPEPRTAGPEGVLPGLGLPALAGSPPAAVTRPGGRRRPPPPWRMRARDAFFRYVELPAVAQQIGAVLEIDPRPDGSRLRRADLLALLRKRLPALTTLRRVMVERGRGRRPGWVVWRQVDPAAHVDEHHLPDGAGPGAVIDRFWSEPVRTDRPAWQMLLITDPPGDRTWLVIKLHHCLGDGLAIVNTLTRLLDPAPDPEGGSGNSRGSAGPPEPEHRVRTALRWGRLAAVGLVRLAVAGRAPRAAINRPLASSRRRLVTTSFPAAEVSRVARAHRCHPSELFLALTAEALHRALGAAAPPRLRAMFAVSSPERRRAPTQGNWTGAVSLDLPTGVLPLPRRIADVRRRLRRGLRHGEPVAAELVMRLLGLLPAPLHAALARQIYRARFMNAIVSYMSGPREPQLVAGAPVRAAFPVVPLADEVPIGIAALRWAAGVGIGVLLDESLAARGVGFIQALQDGFQAAGGREGVRRCD